jgi:ribosomal protein S14
MLSDQTHHTIRYKLAIAHLLHFFTLIAGVCVRIDSPVLQLGALPEARESVGVLNTCALCSEAVGVGRDFGVCASRQFSGRLLRRLGLGDSSSSTTL